MRLARLPFVWRTSAALNVSRYYANYFVKEFRLGEPILKNLHQRQNSTKAGTQPNKNARWIVDDDETPSITWPEPISWSQPMRGPGCARGEMFNTADQIQDQLHDDGHRIWGFVVYRCTYGDDAAWQSFLERIHKSARHSMEYYHGLDLLEEERFKLTVLEDKSKFDGASVQLVREHFKEWRKKAVREDQGTSDEIEARRVKPAPICNPWRQVRQEVELQPRVEVTPDNGYAGSKHGYGYWHAAVRYRFCVHIDEAALQSIVSPEGEECYGDAWVNLIEADWDLEEVLAEGEQDREQARIDHIDMGGTLEDFDFEEYSEVFPEINGCVEKNVGWMRVQYKALIPEFYSYLQDPNMLEVIYYRPPEIAGKV